MNDFAVGLHFGTLSNLTTTCLNYLFICKLIKNERTVDLGKKFVWWIERSHFSYPWKMNIVGVLKVEDAKLSLIGITSNEGVLVPKKLQILLTFVLCMASCLCRDGNPREY